MYSTFSVASKNESSKQSLATRDQSRPKRQHVPVACESCRKNRIKCDNSRPCRNCKSKNIYCTNVDNADTRSLNRQIQHLLARVEDLEGRLQDSERNSSMQSPSAVTESGSISDDPSISHTAARVKGRPQRDSDKQFDGSQTTFNLSTASFASKLNQVLDGRFGWKLFVDLEAPSITPSGSSCASRSLASGELSRTLQDYYIRLYWRMIHRSLPVLEQDDFKAYYASLWDGSSTEGLRLPSCLVDIVLALSLQHESNLKPREAPGWTSGCDSNERDQDQVAAMGRFFFQRCWAELLLKQCHGSSLSTLQCYILIVVYLRNESSQNAAYLALGFAIRAANILGFHRKGPASMSEKEQLFRERLWDMLCCLDTQQFLESGHPFGIFEHTPLRKTLNLSLKGAHGCGEIRPSEQDDISFFSCYSELIQIAKSAQISLDITSKELAEELEGDFHTDLEIIQYIEPKAAQHIELLTAWAKRVPNKLQLHRKSDGAPFTTDTSLEIDADISVWRLQQCLLLELSYHRIKAAILRCFLDPSSVHMATPPLKRHAQCALQHALAVTSILNQALNETEAIHGWYDSHVIQWDATLTMVAFILSQPASSLSEEASHMLSICGSIFDALGTRFTHAAAEAIKELHLNLSRVLAYRGDDRKSESTSSRSDNQGLRVQDFAAKAQDGDQMLLDDFSENFPGNFGMATDFDSTDLPSSSNGLDQLFLSDDGQQSFQID